MSRVTRLDFVTIKSGKPCLARVWMHLRVIWCSVSSGWYGSVQSLIITGSFCFVFFAICSIWSDSVVRGVGGPLKVGNFVA